MGSFGKFPHQLQKSSFFPKWKNVENKVSVIILNTKEIASAVAMLNSFSFYETIPPNVLIFPNTF